MAQSGDKKTEDGRRRDGGRGTEGLRDGETEGGDRIILSVRPGITGPDSLKYRDEEAFLAEQDDPERYNDEDEVLWPE